jgi:hypothetical protein
MNFLQKLFHTHEYRWETPNGSNIPLKIDIPFNKKLKVIRVCNGCEERTTQYWGNIDGEAVENW